MSLKKLMDLLYYPIFEKVIVNFPTIADCYVNLHEKLVKNEIKLANISSSDRVLHIGCGAIPATSILLAKKTGASVVGIDRDNKSYIKASQYVARKGFADKIQIKKEEALLISSLDKFNVIIISRGVTTIKPLLNHILSNMKPNTRVILRIPSDDKKKYENIINTIFLKRDAVTSYGTTTSILLSKTLLVSSPSK